MVTTNQPPPKAEVLKMMKRSPLFLQESPMMFASSITVPEYDGVVTLSSLEKVDDEFLRHVMTLPLPAGDPLGGALE